MCFFPNQRSVSVKSQLITLMLIDQYITDKFIFMYLQHIIIIKMKIIAVFLSCRFLRSGTEKRCMNVAYININIDHIGICQY